MSLLNYMTMLINKFVNTGWEKTTIYRIKTFKCIFKIVEMFMTRMNKCMHIFTEIAIFNDKSKKLSYVKACFIILKQLTVNN